MKSINIVISSTTHFYAQHYNLLKISEYMLIYNYITCLVRNLLFPLKYCTLGEVDFYFLLNGLSSLISLLHYCLVSLNTSLSKFTEIPEARSNGSTPCFPQVVRTETLLFLTGNKVIFFLLHVVPTCSSLP